jgi:arylsulfatase
MDRRTFLKTSAVLAGVSGIQTGRAAATEEKTVPQYTAQYGKNPNVLFILSDQHNAKVMGHQGHPDVKTPNFDKMAKQGTRFDVCTTANTICTPSRVSFISGQYCHNHGYYGLSGPHPKGLPTLFGHFRSAGYKTAAIGKIHCPANWVENDNDCYHETLNCSVGGQSPEYKKYLEDRGLTRVVDELVLWEFGEKGVQSVDGRPSNAGYRDSAEGWSVTKSIAFMDDCVKDNKPFFVHVSLPRPHQCYTPAKEFWDLYDQSKLTLPPNADWDMKGKAPNLIKQAESFRKGDWTLFEPKTFEAGRLRKLQGYLGCVSHVDHAVGELLEYLDRTGLAENTIVVYSSDHGDYACEHDIMEKAPGISSDAITRVPMLWQWPDKIKAGHAVKDVVETIDMAPTLCSLAGLPVFQTADGHDLSDYLKGAQTGPQRGGLTEFPWSKSLRFGKWRLVTYPRAMFEKDYPDGFGELYDVEADPWEMKNLYFEADYAAVRADLERRQLEMLITTTRPATIMGSDLTKPKDGPQTVTEYHHTVNRDGKMHYDRIKAAAAKKWAWNYI